MTLPASTIGRRYGRRPDVPDHRDKIMRLAPVVLPPDHDEVGLGLVRDQAEEGSCVGHGWKGHGDWLFKKFGVHHLSLNLSPQFVYYLARKQEGTLPEDGGAQVRTGATVFNQFGICPENEDLYGPQTLNVEPTAQALADALTYKGGAYHRLETLQDMKLCLGSGDGYCFVDGIEVYQSFESDDVAQSGDVPMPAPGETLLGGHCTLTFGYDDNHINWDGSKGALHKRNSWGTGWGQDGDFWLPYAYAEKYLSDAWILHLGHAW